MNIYSYRDMEEWADEMREEVKIFPYCVIREEATDKNLPETSQFGSTCLCKIEQSKWRLAK